MGTLARDVALIGPNAVIQLGETLLAHGEAALAARVYDAAGHPDWLRHPPSSMTPQADVVALHLALQRLAPADRAEHYAIEAGRRTGDYLLAHRIPGFARAMLRCLPKKAAARLLLKAIERHAWTFAGSGHFVVESSTIAFRIVDNPLAREGGCVWHEAVFTQLFRRLVDRNVVVGETACCAEGSPACLFEIVWEDSFRRTQPTAM